MANENKGNPGSSPSNGGARPQQQQSQGRQVGQQIRDGAEQVGGRIREGFETARDGVGRGYQMAEKAVSSHPGQSVLIGLGVGFGLGFVLSQLFAREPETWAERNITGPMKQVPDHVHHLADAIVKHLPESVRKHIG